MPPKVLLCCTLLLALAPTGQSQTLRGTVRDASGSAIAGASIEVRSTKGTTQAKSFSNGQFAISGVMPPATVIVAAPGFARHTTEWTAPTQTLSILLSPASLQEQVVVTATRTNAALDNTAASVTSINSRELAAAPALEIDNTLRQVPGFSLFRRSDSRTANPTSQGVSLRGLGASGASRALVLYDAVPLNDPFGGWVYWERVPEQALGGVEVFRGGASPLYGSGALAGVVNFRRSSAPAAVSVDLSAGGQGTHSGSLGLSKAWDKWAASAALQGLATGGYIPVAPNLRGAVDAPANVRYGSSWARVTREVSSGSVFVSADLFNESRQNGTMLQTNGTRLAEGVAGADLAVAGGSLSLRLYGSAQHYNQTFSSLAADRNRESLVRAQAVPSQQIGGSAQWNRALATKNVLVIGGDVRQVRGHTDEIVFTQSVPSTRILAGGRQLIAGGFVEDLLQLGSRLNITAAARVDGWQNYGASSATLPLQPGRTAQSASFPDRTAAAFSPSLGAVVRISNNVSLNASAYGAFRNPTLNELYRAFRLGNVQTLANDALHPERLRGAEGGITLGSGPFLARATLYWNTIHDAIGNRTLQIAPDLITRQRQNLGSLNARGLELEMQTNMARHLWSRLSYAYSNSTVGSSLETSLIALRIPQVPRNSASASLNYSERRWNATLVGRYAGLQYDDDLNQFPLPGYFTADAFLQVTIAHGVDAYIAGENLLDRSYAIARTPTPMLGSGILARAGLRWRWPAAGR